MSELSTAPSADCQQKSRLASAAKSLRRAKAPLKFTFHLRQAGDALTDPRFGGRALRLILECVATAAGCGARSCLGCCERWAEDRPVAAVGVLEFLSVDGAMLVALCADCRRRPDHLQIAVAGLERDFGVPPITVQALSPGGRA
jgi:hypothetical protein